MRPLFLAAAAVVILQALTIGWLLFERRRRRDREAASRHDLLQMMRLERRIILGELASSFAHEINQPLGAILRNSEAAAILLSRDAPPMDEIREIVGDIRADDRRAADLVQRLRRLAGKPEMEAVPLDLAAIARDGCRFVGQDAAAKGVDLVFDAPAAPIAVAGDAAYLRQAVVSLLLNAVDAARQAPAGRRQVTARATAGDDTVELAIVDTGPGFGPEALSRLFEPFFTTRPDGMGMGLPIARRIVEAHAGRLRVENTTGGGAAVRVQLPRNPRVEGPAG